VQQKFALRAKARFNPFRDWAGCTIAMRWQRRLQGNSSEDKTLFAVTRSGAAHVFCERPPRSTISLRSQSEELPPSRKKSFSCRSKRFGDPQVLEAGDGKGRVFKSKKTGDPLKNGRHWFDDAIVDAKIKNFHWHDLRHTFASRLRMKGTPLEDIADLLGHKSLAMTRRYAHLGPNKLHAVVSLPKPSDPASDTEQTGQTAATSQVIVH
jgi:hypothetical protein